jgi:hypothetical protein
MIKLFFLLTFISLILTNQADLNTTKKNSTNILTHSFCRNSENSVFCRNPIILIAGIVLAVIIVILGSYIYMRFFFDENHSFMRGWENLVRQRMIMQREKKRKKQELLIKKKKYYLLNIEIKPISFSKDFANNEEECPICLETYFFDKKVCLTPCKHLFHHICLKEYIYGSKEMKCPICKYDLWESIKDKKINFKKIKIIENDLKNIDKNENNESTLTDSSNNHINININENNERDNLNREC